MPKRQVPQLNLLDYVHGGQSERANFVLQLFNGLKDYGFIILTGHTVKQEDIDRVYQLAREFFAFSDETKGQYSGGLIGGQRGHTSFGKEHAVDNPYPDLKEFWHIGREVLASHSYKKYYPDNIWPKELPDFKPAALGLYKAMDDTAKILLHALGKALDVSQNYFADMIEDGNSILRLIHYPPIPKDAHPKRVRAAAHGDINLITFLVGATGDGLQLLDRDGKWLDVNSGPGQIVVDSGDMLSRITNEVIPSTVHRVINPDNSRSPRYSMPYFVHPHPMADLSCIESCKGQGAKYPPISSHDFLMERLKQIGLA